jgi:hypothetical protein
MPTNARDRHAAHARDRTTRAASLRALRAIVAMQDRKSDAAFSPDASLLPSTSATAIQHAHSRASLAERCDLVVTVPPRSI